MSAARMAAKILVVTAMLLSQAVAAVPFWGAKESMPADTPVAQLKPGEWIWLGDAVNDGPIVIVVSLSEQLGYVYRNGILIGATTVSTGRPGHETPTGVFTILQKDKDHRSTIYNSAPMPYMERLTWGGVALHAGGLPGFPESHGCVHLPSEFARLLFAITSTGITVVIGNDATEPEQVTHPGFLSPVVADGAVVSHNPLEEWESGRWQPNAAREGPVSIVLSKGSGRVVVYRNGIEIGRSRVIFSGSEPIGTHALILAEGPAKTSDRYVPDPATQHWIHIGIAGHDNEADTEPDPALAARIEIPENFVRNVYSVLAIGTTVMVTDEAINSENSGESLQVIDSDPPS